jgi:DNA-binding MarR family transcriptional regulator
MGIERDSTDALAEAAGWARDHYGLRRARARFLDAALFGEPSWDILLDLYIARCEGRPSSTKSACLGAAVPQTTALRSLDRLERAGLIRRWHEASDGRVTHIALTDAAFTRMTLLLAPPREAAAVGSAPGGRDYAARAAMLNERMM